MKPTEDLGPPPTIDGPPPPPPDEPELPLLVSWTMGRAKRLGLGMSKIWPIEIVSALARLFAVAISSTVTPYCSWRPG
jgi:hypothetical protein